MANIIDVNESNVCKHGFFCYMSKKKCPGYQKKLAWLHERFTEGMRIKLLELPERGFIEYIPGEQAWRGVHAEGYMFIHCLWVVGKSKGKGFSKQLLEHCIADARKEKLRGVAMISSEGNWLMSRKPLLSAGFQCVAEAPPAFSLMVLQFRKAELPRFSKAALQQTSPNQKGFTVYRTDQCPYIEDAANFVQEYASISNIPFYSTELKSSKEVQEQSPSPFGVFGIAYQGRLLSYHYLLPKDFESKLKSVERLK
ncbi:MAG: GNAT family N-acetyltransferase [bacterium]|nr:GNAT family N-acetyltransferase [bacterium]